VFHPGFKHDENFGIMGSRANSRLSKGIVMTIQNHWEQVYQTKAADAVSWFRPHLERSLSLIERAAPDRAASVIDVGGGESTLVDDLLDAGYRDVSVLDISRAAIEATKRRLGAAGNAVHWHVGDVTQVALPAAKYDVWHDRAVFHFLTDDRQRSAYVRLVMQAVKPGGHVIVATFGPEGPSKCSGLDVVRYDADGLHSEFGDAFELVESATELHQTPLGTSQQFIYCYCVKSAAA
jgi:2-polyprenyl-3-methyl-5-hydroxy-6-metoxy-1,4-benzoquinol methylase